MSYSSSLIRFSDFLYLCIKQELFGRKKCTAYHRICDRFQVIISFSVTKSRRPPTDGLRRRVSVQRFLRAFSPNLRGCVSWHCVLKVEQSVIGRSARRMSPVRAVPRRLSLRGRDPVPRAAPPAWPTAVYRQGLRAAAAEKRYIRRVCRLPVRARVCKPHRRRVPPIRGGSRVRVRQLPPSSRRQM